MHIPNALKHGIDAASIVIPGEDPAEYDRVAQNHYRTFLPKSALEEFHVDTLIRSDWQRKRLQRVEAKLYRALLAEGADPEDLDIGVLRDSPTAKLLRKVFSQIATLERAFNRALNDLRRIQRERQQAHDDYCNAIIDEACAPMDSAFSRNEPNFPSSNVPEEAPESPKGGISLKADR